MGSEILPPPTDILHTIFVDSNIDTHLALVVSLYDTISEVKAKIAAEHALCFQGIGEIGVQAIKVRRRGFFYNLTDSMYVLNAFDGVQGSWFVCIDIVPICAVMNQQILPNKVTNEHMKHHDDAVPVRSVDKHQEIVFCGLSPKNIDPDGQKGLNPVIDHGHRTTMLIDQEKCDRRKDDCKNLGTEASDALPSATCTHKTISSKTSKSSQQDKLLESQSQHYIVEKRSGKKLKDGLHEEQLEVCRRNKFTRSEDIDESNKSTNASPKIRFDGKKEILANYSEGLPSKLPHENAISLQTSPLEKHTKKRKSKSSKSHEVACLAMTSEAAVVRSPQVITDPQNSGKECNASIFSGKCPIDPNIEKLLPNDEGDMSTTHDTASFLEVANQKETRHSMEVNKEPIEEKHTKKRKSKSSKSHDVACLAMTSEAAVVRSPQVITDPQNSGKEGNASIFSGKCPIEPNIEKLLPNDGDMSTTHDTASFLEVANRKETRHSMEVHKEPIEEKHTKKRKSKSSKSHEVACLAMTSEAAVVRSPQVITDPQNSGKEGNASIFSGKCPIEPNIEKLLPNDEGDMSTTHDTASFLEVANQKETRHSMEVHKEPIEEKHTKKRKSKSSKSHEVACLAMTSEAAVVKSPQVITDPQNSGKEGNASIFSGKCPIEPNIEKLLPNDEGDMSTTHDTASFLEVANQKETRHSMEVHKEPIEEKHTKKRKSKSSKSHEVACLAMTSEAAVVRSPQVIKDPQNSGKEGNASIFSGKCPIEPNIEKLLPNDEGDMSTAHDTAGFLEVANQKESRHSMEVSKEPIEEQILQINPENTEAQVSSQVVSEFPIKLPHENTVSLENPQLEKHTKKRKRKSSKSHEEAPIVMLSGSVVVRSPQLRADSHNSRKETSACIFSGKYPPEPSIEKSLANDETHDTARFLEAPNQKESRHYLKINEEPIEEHILQVDPEDQSKKHLNSDQGTNVDVNLEETAEARVSSHLASESTTKLYCSTDKFQSQSSKILEPEEANDQETREFYATKYITDLNLGEAGYVNANAGISASAEKFPSDELATNAVSSPKGANKDCVFTKVDYKGLSKSKRTTKKSKAELSRASKSAELNGRKDQFNSDNAQVSLNDAQNESNAANFIKQAGDHSIDAIIKISSSSKKVPNQEEVSDMNSGNPPISIPNNLSEASDAFVKQAAEISVPSQTSSEVQAKPRRSRKKSKCESSKLKSPENSDVALLKFNGLVTESNDERGSDPSKVSNKSNQKINLHCMDARVDAPLSAENSSKLVEIPHVNLFESPSCKLQDFTEQSNTEIIVKGHVTQHEPLAAPTKSKCDRKKSKKESLKAQVSSEMSEPTPLCKPGDSTIKFDDYFGPREGKHGPAVHTADPPSGKSESRKKNSTNGKTDINQPYQDSPTNLVQPSSNKQHLAIGEPPENYINHETVDVVHGTGTKDSKTGIVPKAKNTKQSGKQNSAFGRIESDSSLHETHDKPKFDKKLHNYEPESHVQLSKSGAIGNKQRKKIAADGKGKTQSLEPDHDIDNMVSKDDVRYKVLNSSTTSNPVDDAVGSNNVDVSQSDVMATEVASSESTEDTPYEKRRYRVVRKNPSRKCKKITDNTNPENSLLFSSGSILSDASVTNSESENDSCKKKASIKTALDDSSLSVDSENRLEEVQTKASALKLPLDINFVGPESDERGEISKKADGGTKNHSRSNASARKMPLTCILKSSISFKKSKITASQSEFPESQPMDMVLETQPESAAP